jgi:nucleotide-binding universal stress UspA family protein
MSCMGSKPQRVLLGYDGSNGAQRALEIAAALIGYGSTLSVVSVADNEGSAEAALREARERLLERHVSATYVPLYGDAADELVDAAQVLRADLVIVGARTQNGHLGLGLGPVSGDVVERAPCDVLVVK